MAKYIRKDKLTTDFAIMDVSPSLLGVRTRAKTLALQKLQQLQTPSHTVAAPEDMSGSSGSYLQLRSRRLRKPPIHSVVGNSRRHKRLQSVDSSICMRNRICVGDSGGCSNPNSMAAISRLDVRCFPSWACGSVTNSELKVDAMAGAASAEVVAETEGNSNDIAVVTSFGENIHEFDGGERSMRETTPSSLIRDQNAVLTPGSVTRCASVQVGRPTETLVAMGYVPTVCEVDEFFSGPEEQQRKLFMDKYNFDPVKDKPLPGRFKWEKVGQ